MASNYLIDDPILGQVDTDDVFVTDAWLVDQFVGNQLWGWGSSGVALGLNNTNNYSSPVQVGSLINWKQISFGYDHAIALKTDGTLWSWGSNGNGQLGDSTVVAKSSPIQIGTDTNWLYVNAGTAYNSFAIKTNGTLYSWGRNTNGQLGLNDLVHRSSPTQVGSLSNWKQVSSGELSVAAVKLDGTLWTWGYNQRGELAQRDVVHRSSPTQVGSLSNWKQVSSGRYHVGAIKTDGTLWSWGFGTIYGATGFYTAADVSSPIQVGTDTNWKQINLGAWYNSLAIKTDGTLWAWGHNGTGQLGLNDIVHRSSPTQVGSLSNWKKASGGLYYSGAIKTDGTLWMWGHNNLGQVGDGTIVHRSSPVQIGSLTNWKFIEVKANPSAAITYTEI